MANSFRRFLSRRSPILSSRPAIVSLAVLLGLVISGQLHDSLVLAVPPIPGATELDDTIEPLKPKKVATETDRNRIEALSLFAGGRTEEERGNFQAALRLYQRALRYDPSSLPILRRVIDVAQRLDRTQEAIRYAQRAVQIDAADPRLVIDLAEQLTDKNEFEEALKLFELARSQPQMKPKSPLYLTLTLQIGRLKFITGDNSGAAEAFAAVMEGLKNPDAYGLNPEATRLITGRDERNFELFGEALLTAKRVDLAEEAFKLAAAKVASKELYKPIAAYHQAQIQFAREQYSAALKSLEEYFSAKESKQDQLPYDLLGKVLEALKQSDQFLPRLEKLVENDKGNIPLHLFVARKHLAAKNFAGSEKLYRTLLNTSAAGQGYRGLIDLYRENNQPEQLLKTLGEAVDKGGVESISRPAKEIADDDKLLDTLAAQAAALKAKSPEGLSQGVRVVMAMMLLDAKRYDAASDYFRQALKDQPKTAAELYFAWGLGLLDGERYSESAAVFQQGLDSKALPADNPLFHTYLALSLEMAGQTEEALKIARAASQFSGGKNARLESRVCWILYHAKRYPEALTAYEKLLARFDLEFGNEDNRRVMREARLALSNICVNVGDMPRAEEFLEQVLDEFPEDVSALNDLGYLWADQGKHLERALEMLQRAVAASPENEAYRDSLGWALYRLKRYDEAVVELQKAAAVDDPDGVILDHLADCLSAMGKRDEALAAWKRAQQKLQRDGDTEKAKAIEQKIAKPPSK